jgi:small conductance mechanosensitive channel
MKTHRLLIVGLVSVLYSQPGYAFVQEDTAGAKQVSLREETEALAGELEQLSSEFFALSEQARSAEGEELLINVDIDNALKAFGEMCGHKEVLNLDTSGDFAYLDDLLQERGDALTGWITLAQRQASDLSEALTKAEESDQATLNAQLAVVRERLHGATSSLDAAVKLMDARGLDTAELKRLLISSSGQITADIFDIEVATGLIRQWWKAVGAWFSTNAPQFMFNLLLFAVIVLIFALVGKIATRVVQGAMGRAEHHVPQLLRNMAISFTSKVVLLLGILIALSQIGVEIGPLLAGVGVAGFIIGFALQETLSNFASGLMILFYQPFDVGDVVEAGGVSGKVSNMNLVSTTIKTFDNQKLIVPNNKIWGDVIRNKTAENIRRVDMVFGISYSDDIDKAEKVLTGIVSAHDMVLDEPQPMIRLHNLGDSSVDFVVRPWTKTDDYWTVFWDVTRSVKKRFDEEGISIPFPQRDVHVYQEAVPPGEPVDSDQ